MALAALPPDEREAFHAHWYNEYHAGHLRARPDGTYAADHVQRAWIAWQARARLAVQGGDAASEQRVAALEAALAGARIAIVKDRDVLVECHLNPRTGKVEGAEPYLGEYKAVLRVIDAALSPRQPEPGTGA